MMTVIKIRSLQNVPVVGGFRLHRGKIVKRARTIGIVLAIVCLIRIGLPVGAAEPPAGPPTLWSFLGIPQGVHKLKDGHLNKHGDHPKLEHKPPLKRLADPANLEAQNPAIKAAAKIKTEEDLAPQKVKAIKYLATIGCGCYPGVREALLAALEDCTEEVRYEAAEAFAEAAGNPCQFCNRGGCCSQAVIAKLEDMAHGLDDQGCPKEASARVRDAAERALNACRMVTPPEPTPSPRQKELPAETPSVLQNGKEPTPAGNAPIQLKDEDQAPAPPEASTRSKAKSALEVTPAAATVAARITDQVSSAPTAATQVAFAGRRACGCRVPGCRHAAGEVAPSPTEAAPGEAAPAAPAEEAQPAPNALAGNFGAASGPMSAAPNMIGDFFGAGVASCSVIPLFSTDSPGQYPPQSQKICIPNPAAGGVVGRTKIADNTSPLPRDRLLFDYNLFDNVPLTPGGVDVHRFTPGFEKTFFDGMMSFEMKIPMAVTLDNALVAGDVPNVSHGEFGNMALTVKSLLWHRETWALSGGLTIGVPTADATTVAFANGTQAVEIKNEAVHLAPFLGFLWTPDERWFTQAFLQWDLAANDNSVSVLANQFDNTLTPIGSLHDTSFQYLDLGLGYWLYRNPDRYVGLTGLAGVAEVHWNTSLQDTVPVESQGYRIGSFAGQIDVVDVTIGAHLEFANRTTVTLGYATPLGAGADRGFDGEFRIMLNRYFGPRGRFEGIPPM